jgi:hypothetical protein
MSSSYFGHSFNKSFIGTGALKSTGDTSTLLAGELGLFDHSTFEALGVASGNPFPHKLFIIAQGSYHEKDSLSTYYGGLKESVKSRPINSKFIQKLWKVEPQRPQSEVWTIGWDGVNDCKAIAGVCDEEYTIRLEVQGDPVLKLHNRNYYKEFTVKTPCCDECSVECIAASVDPKWIADQFVKQINNDEGGKNYWRASVIFDDLTDPLVAPDVVVATKKWRVTVCDAGTVMDLAAVAASQPNYIVTRVLRDGEDVTNHTTIDFGTESTYELCAPVIPLNLLEGGTLPKTASFTAVVNTRYNVDTAVGAVVVTLPASNPGEVIEIVDFGQFAGTNAITFAGAAIITVTTIATDGGAMTITDDGAGGWIGAVMTPNAISNFGSTAWVDSGDFYRTARTLYLTLDGTSTQLSDVEGFYLISTAAIVPGSFAQNSSTTCGEVITVQQYNNSCLEDGCNYLATAEYDEFPSYLSTPWLTEDPCAVAPASYTGKVGIRIETAFAETKFGTYSFDPMDHYNLDGLRLSVSLKDDADGCSKMDWSSRKIQDFRQASGTGESVLRDYLLSNNYRTSNERFERDIRFREVEGQNHLDVVDRNKYYKCISLTHFIPTSNRGMNSLNYNEVYTLNFMFEESINTVSFEALIESYANEAGVEMEVY